MWYRSGLKRFFISNGEFVMDAVTADILVSARRFRPARAARRAQGADSFDAHPRWIREIQDAVKESAGPAERRRVPRKDFGPQIRGRLSEFRRPQQRGS